jgi:hypothetical protein
VATGTHLSRALHPTYYYYHYHHHHHTTTTTIIAMNIFTTIVKETKTLKKETCTIFEN